MHAFKLRRFHALVILQCVRWYSKYTISYRQLEEMMAERGVVVDHTTIWRWIQRYAPQLEKEVRWYQGRQGVSRLDCYYEENDHKYFITPQSVERAITEELAKARELGVLPNPSEPVTEEKVEEPVRPPQPQPEAVSQNTQAQLHELELKNRDLEIATRAKDM